MKIINIEYFQIDMPLAMPYTIAYEMVNKATNIVLKITTDKGLTGWGCAAPDLQVTRETPEDVIKNIENTITGLLQGESPFQVARITQQIKEHCPQASSTLAMVDMALYDLLARKARLPLYQLLGGYRHQISTSITIGILPVKQTLEQAGYYFKKGFTIIKLKGGVSLEDDIEKILKLREKYGKHFELRFDANQGYTPGQAIALINKTEGANIAIMEQPTAPQREDQLGVVKNNVATRIMADESLKTLTDAFRLASNKLTDMVNIKIMKVGGLLEAQQINSVAKAGKMEVMVGCVDECMLGISAGLHFALSKPNIEYADLDGHLDLLEDPFSGLFNLKNGILYPGTGNGLGTIKL